MLLRSSEVFDNQGRSPSKRGQWVCALSATTPWLFQRPRPERRLYVWVAALSTTRPLFVIRLFTNDLGSNSTGDQERGTLKNERIQYSGNDAGGVSCQQPSSPPPYIVVGGWRKESETVRTNGESKFSYLLVGLGLGAIGGAMAALLARKETRDLLRERSSKTVDYLNQQGEKLRETAEGIVGKGKELMSPRCRSVDATTEAENQVYQEERRENMGG